MLQQPTQLGASIPQGSSQNGTFKPVTFRSGTGTSTPNEAYSGLSGLVGQGNGLLGQAGQGTQQAPNQFNYNVDPNQRAQDLYSQRSALLEPQFAQQRAQGVESMFGSGRLGLRLAGEGVGAGNGMVQPDAFGMNQAQSQALAQIAAGASNDAFGQSMQMGQQQLQNQQFNQNYGLAQQQQLQDYGLAQQNYGLAQQQQMQDYGLGQQKMGLATQQQLQDYQMGMLQNTQGYGLERDALAQNYELNTEQNRISAILGQAQANKANYQPSFLDSAGLGLIGGLAGNDNAMDRIFDWFN